MDLHVSIQYPIHDFEEPCAEKPHAGICEGAAGPPGDRRSYLNDHQLKDIQSTAVTVT